MQLGRYISRREAAKYILQLKSAVFVLLHRQNNHRIAGEGAVQEQGK